LAAIAVPGAGRAQEKDQTKLLLLQARLLEEELALAKLPNAYFLLDLREKRLLLRAGGTDLRSWELRGVRAWGAPSEVKTLTLMMKTTLNPPERVEIKPGGEEETPAPATEKDATKKSATGSPTPASPEGFELEALELKEMPRSFQMVLDGGLRVSVRAAGQSLGSTVGRVWNALRWSVGRPLEALYLKARRKPVRVLELTLDAEKDVQALYWSLYDGIKGLIWYTPDI
ncbi:MAG: hypothetical protein OEW05_06170, partial [Candidatus Aminicenantes bacterium]|nr:hypothetical protein [Candidatus Aminicenantes bacterium]